MKLSLTESLTQPLSHISSNVIPVVCGADDRYAMPLTVMVCSILANLDPSRKLLLFIIDGGIKEHNKQRLAKFINPQQCTVEWLHPSESLLKDLKLTGHFSIAIYYRLLMPELLPQTFDRAIYLDCDLVVNTDLGFLWDTEIGDHYLLAALDTHFPNAASVLMNSEKLGIPPDRKYFNSGVLVVNLKKWRTQQISSKVIRYIDQHPENIRYPDQDGLNIVLADQWGELDLRWNQTPFIYYYSSWQDSPFDQETYDNVTSDPWIVHFASKFKPWNTYRFHKQNQKLFYHYLDMTDWSGWRFTLLKAIYTKLRRLILKTEAR